MVEDTDNGWGNACVEAGSIWEITVSSAENCCEPKTAIKNKVYPPNHTKIGLGSISLISFFFNIYKNVHKISFSMMRYITLTSFRIS